MNLKNSYGFTFLELIIILVIVGVLTTLIFQQVGNAQARQRDQKRIADIGNVRSAIDLFIADTGGPPGTTYSDGVATGCSGTWATLSSGSNDLDPSYIDRLPTPPATPVGVPPISYSYACRRISVGGIWKLQSYVRTDLERGSSVAAGDGCNGSPSRDIDNRRYVLRRPSDAGSPGVLYGC